MMVRMIFTGIMHPFNYLIFSLGLLILIVVLVDVFKSVIYINGGGRLSTFVSKLIWNCFYKLAGKRGESPILNYTGGILLLILVFMWIFLIWIGYCLIYLADANSVIDNSINKPADVIGKIYFVGYTLTSLGNGGYSPGSGTWKIVSNLMGLNTTVFISLGISYLLPVLQAIMDKRTLAVYINTLGSTPNEIIRNGYNGKNFDALYHRFGNLENLLLKHGERHVAYPILHYFHTNHKAHSLPLSLAMLDEVMTIQEVYKIDQSDKAFNWDILRGALENFYNRLDDRFVIPSDTPPPFNYLKKLPDEFIKDYAEDTTLALAKFQHHRCKVLGYIHKNGWDWDDVLLPKGQFDSEKNIDVINQ